MTGAVGTITASDSGERAWRAARDAADIQYAPLPPKPVEPPPEWLEAVMRFLARLFEPVGRWLGQLLGGSWGVVEVLLLAGAIAGAAWIAWSLLWPRLRSMWKARQGQGVPDDGWAPDQTEAQLLLADADALAGQGAFGEAAHLLLRRSVQQIAQARPEWLSPSSTAREIAGIAGMPAMARDAFGAIVQEVEQARYALRALNANDWARARTAYANFAQVSL